MGAFGGLVGVFFEHDAVKDVFQVALRVGNRLGVGDDRAGVLGEQVAHDQVCRAFASVARIRLEGKPEDRNLLVGDRVEHAFEHPAGDAMRLPFVDFHDAFPVGGDFGESVVSAQVNEVQDVFLEAAAAKADRSLEELGANPMVLSHDKGDFIDIGAGLFAESADRVDRADALRKERVRRELRKFGTPEVRREDSLARNPVRVDFDHLGESRKSRLRLVAADEHAVRFEKVLDGGAFGEKFRVGKDLEMQALVVGIQDAFHRRGGADGKRRFFDDNLVRGGDFENFPGGLFPVLQVARLARALSKGLGRRIDRDEDDVRFADRVRDVRAEEEVPPASALDDFVEAGFKDREAFAVPGVDARLVDIDDGHFHVRTLVRDDRHRRSADIAGADAKNFRRKIHHGLKFKTFLVGYIPVDPGDPPKVHPVFAFDVIQIAVFADSRAETRPKAVGEGNPVGKIGDVLPLHDSREWPFRGKRFVVIRIELLVALPEPGEFHVPPVPPERPFHRKPQILCVRTAPISQRIIDKEHVREIRIGLRAIVGAIHAAARILEQREPFVPRGRVRENRVQAKAERTEPVRLDRLAIADQMAQDVPRRILSGFSDRALDVVDSQLVVEARPANRAKSQFERGVRLRVSRRIVVVPEHERVDGPEFDLLAADDGLLDHVEPDARQIHAQTVIDERLVGFRIDAVSLVVYLQVRLLPDFGRGIDFAARRGRRAVQVRIQRADEKVVAENSRRKVPENRVVIGRAAESERVGRRPHVRLEAPCLDKSRTVFPLGKSLDGNVDVEVVGQVGRVRRKVVLVPRFDILPERQVEIDGETAITSAEVQFEHRIDGFVLASRFQRNLQPAPVCAVAIDRVRGEGPRLGRTVKSESDPGTDKDGRFRKGRNGQNGKRESYRSCKPHGFKI